MDLIADQYGECSNNLKLLSLSQVPSPEYKNIIFFILQASAFSNLCCQLYFIGGAVWHAKIRKKKPPVRGRYDAICRHRPHVCLAGLDLAPSCSRLLSGQRASSLALLFMTIYVQIMIGMITIMSSFMLHFFNSSISETWLTDLNAPKNRLSPGSAPPAFPSAEYARLPGRLPELRRGCFFPKTLHI